MKKAMKIVTVRERAREATEGTYRRRCEGPAPSRERNRDRGINLSCSKTQLITGNKMSVEMELITGSGKERGRLEREDLPAAM